MKHYDYFTLGTVDDYGQEKIPTINDEPVGTIRMSINISSLSTQDNINYKDCNYMGLTQAEVNDTYVIKYGKELLKVHTVNAEGRLKQVFMKAL